jgi:hypothetical protein
VLSRVGAVSGDLKAVKRSAQGEPSATGIGADYELDHEAARAVRVFDAEVGEACLPGLFGYGLIPVAERAVPEIFAHDSLLEPLSVIPFLRAGHLANLLRLNELNLASVFLIFVGEGYSPIACYEIIAAIVHRLWLGIA